MILLKRIDKSEFWINAEMFETVEAKPDTVITLFNGKRYIVLETPQEVVSKVLEFKQKAYRLGAEAQWLERDNKERNREPE
ncbi:MAG TPA: flagellar FlbD family protein [Thermotogota bacterium]|nr:flagellar FlbD family protein [Thermotogota bacterium]HRW92661.1 flagellar FlbD family protein [Thermotogota bacterium]